MTSEITTVKPPPLTLNGVLRLGASGLCFLGFTVLASFGTIVLLPIALLLPGARARRVRRLVSFSFRMLLFFIRLISLGRVHIAGQVNMEQAAGCLLIANHPSFMDIVVLFARMPDANCIMKDALRRHPLFAPFVHAGGYLSNSSDPLETMAACRAAKERGEVLIIFPEGSRTRAGTLPAFRRGAAQIALRAGMDILPVTLRCDPPVLTHGRPWCYMPPQRVEYSVHFHAPRPPEDFVDIAGLPDSLAARRLTRALQEWFIRQPEIAQPTADAVSLVTMPAGNADTPLPVGRSRS